MSNGQNRTTVIRQEEPIVERQRLSLADVLAQWAQNLGGGVGLAIVVGVAVNWRGAPAEESVTVALRVGLIVFGVLMAIRAVVDELLDGQAYMEVLADNGDLQQELAEAHEALRLEKSKRRDAEHEAERLRIVGSAKAQKNFTAATPEVSDPIGQDARTLVEVYYAHPDPAKRSASRRAMEGRGWSQDRYRDAMAVLRTTGVVRIKGTQPQWVATEEQALELLRKRA
jgi:hypothetical protein